MREFDLNRIQQTGEDVTDSRARQRQNNDHDSRDQYGDQHYNSCVMLLTSACPALPHHLKELLC